MFFLLISCMIFCFTTAFAFLQVNLPPITRATNYSTFFQSSVEPNCANPPSSIYVTPMCVWNLSTDGSPERPCSGSLGVPPLTQLFDLQGTKLEVATVSVREAIFKHFLVI